MKKFFKKPLNIVSVALAVLGLVGILVMLIVPHGGKYVYKETKGDIEYSVTYKFKGDKVKVTMAAGKLEESAELSYKIKDGKISITDFGEGAKINAFKITSGSGEDKTVAKCTMTYVFFVIACAMTVAGAAGIVYGALTLKKKKK